MNKLYNNIKLLFYYLLIAGVLILAGSCLMKNSLHSGNNIAKDNDIKLKSLADNYFILTISNHGIDHDPQSFKLQFKLCAHIDKKIIDSSCINPYLTSDHQPMYFSGYFLDKHKLEQIGMEAHNNAVSTQSNINLNEIINETKDLSESYNNSSSSDITAELPSSPGCLFDCLAANSQITLVAMSRKGLLSKLTNSKLFIIAISIIQFSHVGFSIFKVDQKQLS